jgi:molecular chaperone DnaJ
VDHYSVLGVRREATAAEVRRAYQKLARALHPDLNPGDPVAAQRFEAVSTAFATLSDPDRRAEYDRGEQPPAPQGVPDVGFAGFDFSAEVRVGSAGFRDIFEGVLSPEGPPRGATSGEDLQQVARITFEECFTGAARRFQAMRQDRCPSCAGSGRTALDPVTCPRCHGSGQVRASRGHMIFSRRCPQCDAAGVLHRECRRCHGEGRTLQSEWIEIQVPPGAADGTRLRLPGAGNAGRRGGAPGDFVLTVEVEPHARFRREGDDLHCLVPITITEAALGGHVEVPTPDGAVPIELPAGTQNGQRFRLRKRGLPRLGSKTRGDLFVEARVFVPTVRDDRSRELLREFALRNPANPRHEMPGTPAAARKA